MWFRWNMSCNILTLWCLLMWHDASATNYASDTSVQLLQEYIRINTTTYNNLTEAVQFWQRLAAEDDLPINVYELSEGFPIVVIKWAGTNSSENSVMLNSHMDVVPADEDDGWSYGPFSGHLDDNNDIYGRGTQDMKSVSLQYFLALRRLKANNTEFVRDVYMTLMPDEEVGAEHGMRLFLKSDEFAAMNVGIELDEGTSYPIPMVPIFYQDKVIWQIQVDCYGAGGHGSTFPATNATATGKCENVIRQMFELRDEQYKIAQTASITNSGGFTSINLNRINGGTANNVIPSHISLEFDIRLNTTLNVTAFQEKLESIIANSGDNITLSYILKDEQSPASVINSSNPYWTAILAAAASVNYTLLPTVPPGTTDARFVRLNDIPAFGISPMPNTTLLLHSVNEHLNAEIYLKGIDLYEQIIGNLATIPAKDTSEDPSIYIVHTT